MDSSWSLYLGVLPVFADSLPNLQRSGSLSSLTSTMGSHFVQQITCLSPTDSALRVGTDVREMEKTRFLHGMEGAVLSYRKHFYDSEWPLALRKYLDWTRSPCPMPPLPSQGSSLCLVMWECKDLALLQPGVTLKGCPS